MGRKSGSRKLETLSFEHDNFSALRQLKGTLPLGKMKGFTSPDEIRSLKIKGRKNKSG